MDNAGLTEEERAALDDTDDAPPTPAAAPEQKAEAPESPAAAFSEPPPAEPAPVPQPAPAAAPAAAPAPVVEPEPEQPKTFIPTFSTDVPENIEAQEKELKQLYEDGEITIDEYLKRRDEMRDTIVQAKVLDTINRQQAEQRWNADQDVFFERNPHYLGDPMLRGALENLIESKLTDAQQQKKYFNNGMRLLDDCRREIEARFTGAAQQPQAPVASAVLPVKPQRGNSTVPLPRTLGGLPTAETPGALESKFDQLDKLGGVELEEAIAALSSSERATYEARN